MPFLIKNNQPTTPQQGLKAIKKALIFNDNAGFTPPKTTIFIKKLVKPPL